MNCNKDVRRECRSAFIWVRGFLLSNPIVCPIHPTLFYAFFEGNEIISLELKEAVKECSDFYVLDTLTVNRYLCGGVVVFLNINS